MFIKMDLRIYLCVCIVVESKLADEVSAFQNTRQSKSLVDFSFGMFVCISLCGLQVSGTKEPCDLGFRGRFRCASRLADLLCYPYGSGLAVQRHNDTDSCRGSHLFTLTVDRII